MFDGVPAEQLHQFIAASRTSLPLPIPIIPLSSFPNLQPFDPNPHHHHNHHNPSNYNIITPQLQQQQLVQLPPPQPTHNQQQVLHPSVLLQQHLRENDQENKQESGSGGNLVLPSEIEREGITIMPPELASSDHRPWSNDELLALLRIRSTMENWFPEFTWEHVSRKLAEAGFKRSAEKCKEKFEEESRYFNNINFNKNFRFLGELEQLYNPATAPAPAPAPDPTPGNNHLQTPVSSDQQPERNSPKPQNPSEERVQDEEMDCQKDNHELDSPRNDQITACDKEAVEIIRAKSRKRKRQRRFEMLKNFCEEIVQKLMTQQEEIHKKLMEDMKKRDEEKVAREEAWKKAEIERMNKEIEIMANEQAAAGDRQATIIQFLKKFTSSNVSVNAGKESDIQEHVTSSAIMVPAGTKSSSTFHTQNNPSTPTSVTETIAPQSPSSSTPSTVPKVPISSPLPPENPSSDIVKSRNPSSSVEKVQDPGKRWPRDEVLALINIRCSLFTNGDQQEKDEAAAKAPLWERISQGMAEMGYKRNAKRCKEKWENINKYFRKTKDVNKKRSVDSRTCPYFHQLSTLYNQGILVPPSSDHAQLETRSPENQPSPVPADDEGEENNNNDTVQQQAGPAAFEFEF